MPVLSVQPDGGAAIDDRRTRRDRLRRWPALGVLLVAVLATGCAGVPETAAGSPASATAPVAERSPEVGSDDFDDADVALCVLGTGGVLDVVATDLDQGHPGFGASYYSASCVFATPDQRQVVVLFGVRDNYPNPIEAIRPSAQLMDGFRSLDIGDAAYFDVELEVLRIALDTRVLDIDIRYGDGRSVPENVFRQVALPVVEGLGGSAWSDPSVDPCSLFPDESGLPGAGELELQGSVRVGTDFGPGQECRMHAPVVQLDHGLAIAVIDDVDPAIAAGVVAGLRPIPELGDVAYQEADALILLDGTRVFRIHDGAGSGSLYSQQYWIAAAIMQRFGM